MNLSKHRSEVKARNDEDQRDIEQIIAGFKCDGYTRERLNKALIHANNYETQHGGSRGNRNVISAINKIIQEPTLQF